MVAAESAITVPALVKLIPLLPVLKERVVPRSLHIDEELGLRNAAFWPVTFIVDPWSIKVPLLLIWLAGLPLPDSVTVDFIRVMVPVFVNWL